ncbi:MAG: DNA polymerase III subunit delta' [Chloroflexi bacterium]|nr:DNA polymerase III subunit delta' [Chloroflexota bacterium]
MRVLGQEKALAFLENSLKAGQLAHAYLLVGPEGVGKRTLALHLAQALFCRGERPPCGECSPCRRIASGGHPDVTELAPRATSSEEGSRQSALGIDQIRELERLAHLMPFEGPARVFIVTGADLLSGDAAHAFLKTLEEPPPQVHFFLLAERAERLPATIHSRCQRLELGPVPLALLEGFLRQECGLPSERAKALARLSRGRPGWALSALAEPTSLQGYEERLGELWSLLGEDLEGRFAAAARRAESRATLLPTLEEWQGWWRDLLVVKAGLPAAAVNLPWEKELLAQAQRLSLKDIASALARLQETRRALELNAGPRLALENLFLGWPRLNPEAAAPAVPLKNSKAGFP